MAYIEGQSLRKKIDSGSLELEEALKIAAQVAEGLQEAHKKGIIHRDIKSVNIMVTAKGQAKVMDFGLARVAGATLVTREGMTMGTVTYMSPEQARGDKVDQRTGTSGHLEWSSTRCSAASCPSRASMSRLLSIRS
jgi:serine/threonine protein kinase